MTETHAGTGQPDSEVSVLSGGALTLVIGRGESVSSRGLLAGGNLETLTRLVDALPPSSYSASCPDDGYSLTVTVRGTTRTFVSGSCDFAVPATVQQLHDFLSGVGASAQAPRIVVVPFQVLLTGTSSAIHRPVRTVIEDRDALVRFLREHSPDQPTVVPRVDFSKRFVVAEWLGDRPRTGYTVELDGAEITPAGWFRLRFHRYFPGSNCATGEMVTQPFVLVAIDRHPGQLLFEDTIGEVTCD